MSKSRWVSLVMLFAMACDSAPPAEVMEGDGPDECADGVDNDADGRFDCDDDGCSADPACTAPDSSESAFGIFASFTPEFTAYERAAGISHAEYLDWAGRQHIALGAHWTRSNLQLVWDRVEPTVGGGYEWSNTLGTEDAFAGAAAADVHYLAVFHEGGILHDDLRNQLEQLEDYQRFVRDAVERYDGDGIDDAPGDIRITHWQVGNETPGLTRIDGGVDLYARWFIATAEAVRQADPEAKMVLIASTDSSSIDSLHREIIPRLVEEGVAFDVVDIHHWGLTDDIEMRAAPEYRTFLDSQGLSDVELWSTEHGTYVGELVRADATCSPECRMFEICVQVGPVAHCVPRCGSDDMCPPLSPSCDVDSGFCQAPTQSLMEQARSLVRRYVVNRDLGVRLLMWNNLVAWHEFGGNYGGRYDRMGLVSGGFLEFETEADRGQPRPSWYAFQMLAARTDEIWAERLGPVELSSDAAMASAYRNRQSGVIGWVAWANEGSTTIERAVEGTGVRVTSFITDAGGVPTRDETIDVSAGAVSIEVDVDPVWIEPLP